MEHNRLHVCENERLHAWVGEHSIMCSASSTFIQEQAFYMQAWTHLSKSDVWTSAISREMNIKERCSSAICLKRRTGVPWAYFRWCVLCFLWQIQIWMSWSVCTWRVGVCAVCMWVTRSTQEHEQVSAEAGIYTFVKHSFAMSRLLKDFHGKNTWQPLRVFHFAPPLLCKLLIAHSINLGERIQNGHCLFQFQSFLLSDTVCIQTTEEW